MSIARSANRAYPISNKWLNSHDADAPAYCDVREIISRQSEYVTWVIAHDPNLVSPNTKAGHAASLNFTMNGIHIGDNDGGPELSGRLKGNPFDTTTKYAQGIEHPTRYGRINKKGTLVRHVMLLGVDAND